MTNLLRTHRHARRLTQSELATLAGLTTLTIRGIELGWQTPRFSTQRRLAEVLGATPDDVFPLPPAAMHFSAA
jgi:DNA-binding XRE family transcriptional regulator